MPHSGDERPRPPRSRGAKPRRSEDGAGSAPTNRPDTPPESLQPPPVRASERPDEALPPAPLPGALQTQLDDDFAALQRELDRLATLPPAESQSALAAVLALRAEWERRDAQARGGPEWRHRLDLCFREVIERLVAQGAHADGRRRRVEFNLDRDFLDRHGPPLVGSLFKSLLERVARLADPAAAAEPAEPPAAAPPAVRPAAGQRAAPPAPARPGERQVRAWKKRRAERQARRQPLQAEAGRRGRPAPAAPAPPAAPPPASGPSAAPTPPSTGAPAAEPASAAPAPGGVSSSTALPQAASDALGAWLRQFLAGPKEPGGR